MRATTVLAVGTSVVAAPVLHAVMVTAEQGRVEPVLLAILAVHGRGARMARIAVVPGARERRSVIAAAVAAVAAVVIAHVFVVTPASVLLAEMAAHGRGGAPPPSSCSVAVRVTARWVHNLTK